MNSERMEAAGVMDAQSGVHNVLENAQTAFPTAPTRSNRYHVALEKLLPRSPDRLLPMSPAAHPTSISQLPGPH